MATPTAPPALGLREAKRRVTTLALAQAAFDLAAERGVDGFTIDDVTTRAGYSRRTFANHFSCKEEAITAVAVEMVRRGFETCPESSDEASLLDCLATLARHQVSGGLIPLLRRLQDLSDDHPALVPHLANVHREIRSVAQRAVAERIAPDASPLYSHLLVGAAYGALTSLLDGRIPVRLDGAPDSDASDVVTPDRFVDIVFSHLRTGFGDGPQQGDRSVADP